MRLITLNLPELYIRVLDDLVRNKYYPNRAEAIRTAVRDLIDRECFLIRYPTQSSEETGGVHQCPKKLAR